MSGNWQRYLRQPVSQGNDWQWEKLISFNQRVSGRVGTEFSTIGRRSPQPIQNAQFSRIWRFQHGNLILVREMDGAGRLHPRFPVDLHRKSLVGPSMILLFIFLLFHYIHLSILAHSFISTFSILNENEVLKIFRNQ